MGLTVGRRRGELLVAGVLVALGFGVIAGALRMSVGTLASPGPALFPLALATGLVVVAGARVVQVCLDRGAYGDALDLGYKHIWLALGAMAGAAFLLERLGFVLTTVLFLSVLFRALAALPWWRAVLGAVAAALVADLFVERILGIRLPGGLL